MRRSLRRLVREPLVHFVVLGSLLLVGHRAFAKKPPRCIEVTREVTAALRHDHERRTGAPPTPEEERALVDRFIDDEVRVREAQALGLDRGDVIVRRRLAQKLDFLLEGESPPVEPTDAELLAFRDLHANTWARPAKLDVCHVFVSRALHPNDADAVAHELSDALTDGADPATSGDSFLRGQTFSDVSETELAAILGDDAAHLATTLPEGTWSAPVASRSGLHLLRVTARKPSSTALDPALRAELREAFLAEKRDAAQKQALAARRRTYDVRIEDGAVGGAR